MSVWCRTAGLHVEVKSSRASWLDLAREACAGQEATAAGRADVEVVVDARPIPERAGYRQLARGAWSDGRSVIMRDACGSGLDLEVSTSGETLRVVASPHATWRHRGLGVLAPDRRVLLHRATLIQYPALWWAGVRGLVPLHVSAARVAGASLMLAGPGGVGKSTLLATLDQPGDVAVSDNLCAVDASAVHGLLEPARTAGGTGRRMPHGRREHQWATRLDSLAPQCILLLRRGEQDDAVVRPAEAGAAVRELVAGTYAAGELRRYWSFAATLALGTGLGPAHPPVQAVSEKVVGGIPAFEVVLPREPGVTLRTLVDRIGRLTNVPAGLARAPEPAGETPWPGA